MSPPPDTSSDSASSGGAVPDAATPVDGARRPLASRDTGWARTVAARLARGRITPNGISIAGMGFAVLAGVALWASGEASGAARVPCLVVAALGCQARLLCNLFDGMVAIEGGRRTPDGALWNELPDRISDLAILVGAGLAVDQPALGWAAGAAAVLTAYVRELGNGIDGVSDFAGPMAKPQRMALITLGALAATLDPLWGGDGQSVTITLWVIVLGAFVTSARRAVSLRRRLLARGDHDPLAFASEEVKMSAHEPPYRHGGTDARER